MIKLNIRKRSAQTHFPIGNPNKTSVVLRWEALGRGLRVCVDEGGRRDRTPEITSSFQQGRRRNGPFVLIIS